MKKKILLSFVIIILFFIVIEKIFIIKIKYDTTESSYNVEINRISKSLTFLEINRCLDQECERKVVQEKVYLNSDEYSYIKSILRQDYDKSSFMSATKVLVMDDKEMFLLGEDGFDENDDLNNDGIITYREFGNSYLKILSK